MVTIKKILVISLVALMSFSLATAEAQPSESSEKSENSKSSAPTEFKGGHGCTGFGQATISVMQFTGELFQNQEKSAFTLAREKSRRYGIKMPMRQGNMGSVSFRTNISVYIENPAGSGCLVVRGMDVEVYVNNKVEIASEHDEGSCMYTELYGLEIELMRQDEQIINENLHEFLANLRKTIGQHNGYRAPAGTNVDRAVSWKRREIENMIKMHLESLEEELFNTRREMDLPEYYAEIEADCSGGQFQ